FSRLRKNNTVFRQEQYSNLDIHHGIFIDIFPLDNVEETYDKEKYRLSTNSVLRKINIIRNKNVNLDNITLSKQALFFIIKMTNYIIPKSAYDKLKRYNITRKNKNNTNFLNHLTNGTNESRYYKYLMSYDDFNEMKFCEFEGHKFPIPKNYDVILTRLYGDYMKLPSKEDRKPHHGIIEIDTNKG